ncbi:Gmad2 immunoglobulin-like domain-containing protein [Paenibacillus sp.]|uniref:Gmad2 immunoglobulin-like domain-containing protein n=1 Tax=Paenibacillus sp. TaxID=58172 RepID=UPI002D49D61E|nr:Gmad2 immunoglobulin-like domain-containing protein [Paenibacillus sp.]HZG58269.1 Gmad2 immunoglobulin-like domain-containing protein [Paenibacillus sp.]
MRNYRGFAAGLLVGAALTAAWPAAAATVKTFAATAVGYPVYVNGGAYDSGEAPVLNVDGRTYVPLRAVGELLGAEVHWSESPRRVDIVGAEAPQGNNAFRNVAVRGSGGSYTITGEARVFEAMMMYAVSDGHDYLLEEPYMVSAGAPAWAAFELKIELPASRLPVNGTLTAELFEYSANDGSKVNVWVVPLESFP